MPNDNPPAVILYSTDYCPYCRRAKSLLESRKIAFQEINITEDDAKRAELQKSTGMRTVPMIFIDGKCIGGCDELMDLDRSGKLKTLLPPN